MQGGQGNLSADIVKNIPFYFANSNEQDKLAKFISLLDERIATQNKIIEKYESLIQAMCDTLVEQETQQVTLSFSDFGQSYLGLSGKSAEDFGEGYPFITYMNVYQNQIIDLTDVGLVKINEQNNSLLSVMAIFFLRYLLKRRKKLEWVQCIWEKLILCI